MKKKLNIIIISIIAIPFELGMLSKEAIECSLGFSGIQGILSIPVFIYLIVLIIKGKLDIFTIIKGLYNKA